jgi:hypothetical protein
MTEKMAFKEGVFFTFIHPRFPLRMSSTLSLAQEHKTNKDIDGLVSYAKLYQKKKKRRSTPPHVT